MKTPPKPENIAHTRIGQRKAHRKDAGNTELLKHASYPRKELQTSKQKMCIPEKIRENLKVEATSQREEQIKMSLKGKKTRETDR